MKMIFQNIPEKGMFRSSVSCRSCERTHARSVPHKVERKSEAITGGLSKPINLVYFAVPSNDILTEL